ncbi:MAG: hypothetical protein AMXMBFR83_31580 [Phycisphaerae bacterium]|jgi:peptidoglycan/xylan/chitin deacetylase (PgdA/CDA1 family)
MTGRAARNRRDLCGNQYGLRILTFHDTGPDVLPGFKRVVDWCRARFPMASPEDVDALFAGTFPAGQTDRVLITFDDGYASNYEAARWLAEVGVRAIFFVVPSFLDRDTSAYRAFHAANGVEADIGCPGSRGLSSGQVAEMLSMGHRLAAHNFAHRDLGRLHDRPDLEYEIARALDAVSEITGRRCEDFAIAYGQPENVSPEAAEFLIERCPRVYACHRGLNLPGRSPRFLLRHDCRPDDPAVFTRVCLQGGGDHHLADRAEVMRQRVGMLPPGRLAANGPSSAS